MRKQSKQSINGLPYVNTLAGILITLGINLLVTLVLYLLQAIDHMSLVMDAGICGVTTSLITIAIVYPKIQRMRMAGELPGTVEEGKSLQWLPKKPVPLALALSVLFAALMAAVMLFVQWFFEITTVTPLRFLVWKLVYATLLSVKITEVAVLRLVQPDCALPGDPVQTGTVVAKDPLPRKETFINAYRTITEDVGFNMLIGLLAGGTIVRGHDIIILATTRAGIVISGLVLGAIVTLRMVYPVAKSIRALRDAGQLPVLLKRTVAACLPERPALFALALLLPVMVISAAVLWAVLTFFGFEELHFFQYFVVRTIYVSLLSKLVVALAIRRYCQPDGNGKKTA